MDVAAHQVTQTPPASASQPSFWPEFQDYWRRVPHKGFFLVLLAAWCALFELVGISSFNFYTTRPSLFQWLYNAWNEPAMDCSHGKLIPWVVAILLWTKRKELMASISEVWWPGLSVVAVALLIHLLGFLAQQPRVSMIALFFGMYALIGLTWGWRTMWKTTFPMVLFAFCMPLGNYAQFITLPMRMISVTLTRMTCHGLLDINVVQRGTELLDPDGKYKYDVVAACSGIRSFVALMAVTLVFAMMNMRSWWRRGPMLLATVPLVICCNVMRLTITVLTGQKYGQDMGMRVHDWVGYLTFLASIGCMLALARWLGEKPSTAGA